MSLRGELLLIRLIVGCEGDVAVASTFFVLCLLLPLFLLKGLKVAVDLEKGRYSTVSVVLSLVMALVSDSSVYP